MSEPANQIESWLTIAEAASRLGLSPFGVRSRIKRGTLRTRKGNHGRVLVAIPASALTNDLTSEPASAGTNHLADQLASDLNGHEAAAEVERWRTAAETARLEAASLRAERDAARELVASLQTTIGDLKGDRETLQGTIDRLATALAEARKGWLERLLEAVRRR